MRLLTHFILIIYSLLPGQISSTANGSIAETGIFLKDLHFDWIPPNKDKGTYYSIDLHEFKFGFSDLNISQEQKGDKHKIKTRISGPNFTISQLVLNAKITSKNWVTGERIRRLEKRHSIPKTALEMIANAIDLYKTDLEENPKSLNDLYVKQYLNLDTTPFDDPTWTYSLALPDQIVAQPTQIHPVAETKPLILDWQSKEIQLDPIRDSLYQVPFVQWDYTLDIQSISQLFSSKLEFDFSPDKTAFDLLLKRSQFKIDDITFTATPGNQLINRSQVHLPSLILNANNIALTTDLKNKPIIHQGHGKFSLRNFEIKIPKGLKEEPEIQAMLESLGIWNNSLKIRLVELEMNLINERTGDIRFIFQTPFLKVNVTGDFSLRQDEIHPDILLHQMEIKIHPIALGVRKWIREWERTKGKSLNRKGATIVLKVEGSLENPVIHGIN